MGAQMDAFEARKEQNDVNQDDRTFTFQSDPAQKPSWQLTNSSNTINYAQERYEDEQPASINNNHAETKANPEWYLSPAAKGPIRPRLPEDWYTGYTRERHRKNSLDEESDDYEDERELHQIRQDVRSPPIREHTRRRVEFDDLADNLNDSWSAREKQTHLYWPPPLSNERRGANHKNGASEDEEYFYGNQYREKKGADFWPQSQISNGFNTERGQKRVATLEPRQEFTDQFPEENGANFYPSRMNNRFATERGQKRVTSLERKQEFVGQFPEENGSNIYHSRMNNRFATERAHKYDAVREERSIDEGRLSEDQWPFRKPTKPVPDFVERFAADAARRNGITQTYEQNLPPRDPEIRSNASTHRPPTFLGDQPSAPRLPIKSSMAHFNSRNNAQRTAGTQTMFRTRNVYERSQKVLHCGQHNLDKSSINIGFVGGPKTGKSTLINALRGLSKDDVGYAGVKPVKTRRGILKPEAPQITPYNCTASGMENSVLWEIPIQTPINSEQFIHENSLQEMDVIFLIIAGAISKEEVIFATTIITCGTPLAFVLSGCDSDMKSQEAETDLQFGRFKARFEQKARSLFTTGIADIAPGLSAVPVYFISAPVIKERQRHADDELPLWMEKYAIDEDAFLAVIQEVCHVTG